MTTHPLAEQPISPDHIGLLEGLATTRSIRRYRDEPIPEQVLRDLSFAASRAPSGSNRQAFRLLFLTEGELADRAKALIARGAERVWSAKRTADGYDKGSGSHGDSPKGRMARAMDEHVANLSRVPALVFPVLLRHRASTPTEGASVYPAVQNLLLAARAQGYGGVLTMWHTTVETELRSLLKLPENGFLAATITLGKPVGGHGPVRRQPLSTFVFHNSWGSTPAWAVDPPGTHHTGTG